MKSSREITDASEVDPENVSSRFKTFVAAHTEACRPDLSCYIGIVGLSGALLASAERTMWPVVAAFLIPALGSTAAYYGGTYFDRALDAVARPGKPVPSGRMSARSALIGMVASAVALFTLAAVLNPVNLVFAPLTVLVGISYGRFRKARRTLRILARGFATIVAFGIGTMATSGLLLLDLMFLSLIFWQQDSMTNLVGAIGDTEADQRARIKTFPVRYGHSAARWLLLIILVCWLGSAALQPASVKSRPFELTGYLAFLGIAGVLAIAATVMLFRASLPIAARRAARAHEVLAFERLCLAVGFVAAAGAVGIGLVLLVLSAAVARRIHSAMRMETSQTTMPTAPQLAAKPMVPRLNG